MSKILVTGAGGYIGSVATYLLLQNGYQVVALDNFSHGYHDPLDLLLEKFGPDKLKIYETELNSDLNPIFTKEKNIEAVLHYAALCKVNESMEQPQKYFTNNVGGTQNLLKTMLAHGVKKLVFSSTCAVYGEAEYLPVDENHPTHPANPYGESKLMVETMIKWYGKLLGLNYVILRYFNVCGASDDGVIGDSKKPSVLLVQNVVRGALGLDAFSLTCPQVDTPDKTPIRDYINVVDLNEAHIQALKHLLSNKDSQIINLGTGQGSSVLEVVETVQKITDKKFELKKSKPRQGEYAKMVAKIEKAKNILNWEPKRSIEDSVNSLIIWYKAHPQGWEK